MIIPQAVFNLYNSTTSDMITQNFGVNCQLVYAANRTECVNCIVNPITRVSAGQYKTGGPIPFNGIQCPYCAGVGFILSSTSEIVKMRVYSVKKNFIRVDDVPLVIKNSSIQTIGFITDLPKLQNLEYMVANTDVAGYSPYKYQLAGEALPHGLGPVKKFFIAFWNRTQ